MTSQNDIDKLSAEAREERREARRLQRCETEIEAEIERRKTSSQLQSEALRGKRTLQDGNPSHRQANALRRYSD